MGVMVVLMICCFERLVFIFIRIGVFMVLNDIGVDWMISVIMIVVMVGKFIVISSGVVMVVGVLKFDVFLISDLKSYVMMIVCICWLGEIEVKLLWMDLMLLFFFKVYSSRIVLKMM